mmetsp:Transcript_63398/g.110503  ORF Transcript_63398/g.110503 Transcript_63398/m.110503 type:complete len:139 (-) Transcript_63398:21-437(-)
MDDVLATVQTGAAVGVCQPTFIPHSSTYCSTCHMSLRWNSSTGKYMCVRRACCVDAQQSALGKITKSENLGSTHLRVPEVSVVALRKNDERGHHQRATHTEVSRCQQARSGAQRGMWDSEDTQGTYFRGDRTIAAFHA